MKITILILLSFLACNSWADQKLTTLLVHEKNVSMVLDQQGQPIYSENCIKQKKKCRAFHALQEIQLIDHGRLRGFTRGSLACEQVGGIVVRAVDKHHSEMGLCQFQDDSYMDLAIYDQRVLALENSAVKERK